MISVDEFSNFLLSRNTEDKTQWLTVDHLTSSKDSRIIERSARSKVDRNGASSQATNESVEYRERLFLQRIKASLIKDTLSRRDAGNISKTDRLGHKTSSLVQLDSTAQIENIFAPLTVPSRDGRHLVPLASFKRYFAQYYVALADSPWLVVRVLRRFARGAGEVDEDVLLKLFDRCCQVCDLQDLLTWYELTYFAKDRNGRIIGEGALPSRLCELIFDSGEHTVDQFGFSREVGE